MPSDRIVSFLLFLPFLGCAGASAGTDLLGLPEVRTVTVGAVSGAGEAVPSTIRYEAQPVLVEETVEGRVEEVHAALLDAYRSEGLTPDGVDAGAGIVSVSRMEWSREREGVRLSALLDCGTATSGRPVVDGARVVAGLAARVADAGEGFARLTLRLGASAYPYDNLAGPFVTCVTTGVLERAILERVRFALGAPADAATGFETRAPTIPSAPSPTRDLRLPIETGEAIRVWLGPLERVGGTYLGVQGGDLVLGTGRRTPVPLARIQEIQVRRTNRSAMLLGALAGVAVGVTVATTTDLGIVGKHEVQGKLLNPGLGALAGGLGGALVASLTFGTSWVRVELPAPRVP